MTWSLSLERDSGEEVTTPFGLLTLDGYTAELVECETDGFQVKCIVFGSVEISYRSTDEQHKRLFLYLARQIEEDQSVHDWFRDEWMEKAA